MDYEHLKHFSLSEARAKLPEVLPTLQKIVDLKLYIDKRGMNLKRHQYFGGSGPNGEGFFPKEMEEIVGYAQELEKEGIILKNIDAGLIDFLIENRILNNKIRHRITLY